MRILIRTSKWAIWARRLGSLALPLAIIPVLLHRERLITSADFNVVEIVAMSVAALGLVLSLGALWLLRQGRRVWFALLPGLFMLVTTLTNLVLLFEHYRHDLGTNGVLFLADIVLLLITVYLLAGGVRAAWAWRRERPIAVTGATGRAG